MGSLRALSLPFSEANRSAVWLSVLLPRRAAHPDNNSCRFNATIRTFLTGPFSLRPFPGIRTVSTVLATIQLRLVANIHTPMTMKPIPAMILTVTADITRDNSAPISATTPEERLPNQWQL